ncbi:MAG: hypothetical protein M3R25_12785 [Bacteroidota bacterium]|nr:hypothetical protein [Bacteroidota bacterium]
MSSPYPPVSQYFHIGKTLKSHGTTGQIRLLLEDRFKEYISAGEYVFFDLNGSKVPYLVTDVQEDSHFVVSLEDVVNKKDSDLLSGQELWIPLDSVRAGHQLSPKNLKDKWTEYKIHDNIHNLDYAIIRTEEYPQQLMAVIQPEKREILIPLSDQLITEIRKSDKIIFMDIPEGLLDL